MGSHSHNQDEHDRRAAEYYDRKTKHREEILKPLVWVYAIALATAVILTIANLFS